MTSRRSSFLLLTIALAAAGVAACSAQSATPSLPAGTSNTNALNPAPNATATATPTPLFLGTSIGVNTFPDGDTSTGGNGQSVDGLLCHVALSGVYHIHVHLSIFDPFGTQIMVPWGVGITPTYTFGATPYGQYIKSTTGCFYNLHTHDRSGVIHDEAASNLNLKLGNFFDFWGMPLSTTNVAGYTGTVWVKIITPTTNYPWSDTINPRSILLTEHMQITLSVGQKIVPVPKYTWEY